MILWRLWTGLTDFSPSYSWVDFGSISPPEPEKTARGEPGASTSTPGRLKIQPPYLSLANEPVQHRVVVGTYIMVPIFLPEYKTTAFTVVTGEQKGARLSRGLRCEA